MESAAARGGGSGRWLSDAQRRAHCGDDAPGDARRAQCGRIANIAPYALTKTAPDADPVAAASQAAYEIASTSIRSSGAMAGDAASRPACARRAQERCSRRWARPPRPRCLRSRKDDMGSAGGIPLSSDGARRLRRVPRAQRHAAGFRVRRGLGDRQAVHAARPVSFASPPPPAIDSAEYTRAFDEVKEVGSFASRTRTADQTHLAMWWKDFAEKLAQPPGARAGRGRRGSAARGALVRAAQHEHLRRLHERVRQQVLLQPLAPVHRDPLGRQGRQSGHRSSRRSGTTCTGTRTRFRRIRPRTARSAARP